MIDLAKWTLEFTLISSLLLGSMNKTQQSQWTVHRFVLSTWHPPHARTGRGLMRPRLEAGVEEAGGAHDVRGHDELGLCTATSGLEL